MVEVVDLACARQVLDGFRCPLRRGGRPAGTVEFGDAWGPELLPRCEEVLLRFAREYGVKPD